MFMNFNPIVCPWSAAVYDELLELVDEEIDKVVENIADDIMLELEKEKLETSDSSDEAVGDYADEEEDDTGSETSVAEEESVEETSEGSEVALGKRIAPSLVWYCLVRYKMAAVNSSHMNKQ